MVNDLAQAFLPLIGQMAWLVEAGYGTFVTLEFGAPHLEVWGPAASPASQLSRVRRAVSRRKVAVTGDWHFWIEHARWKLTTNAGSIDSGLETRDGWQPFLDDLSGQKLVSADSPRNGELVLIFDLGARIEIWPGTEQIGDLWSLRQWNTGTFVCRSDGTLEAVLPGES